MKITKNKNQYFSYIQKQFSKFAVVLVVVSMLFGTLGINQTSAYFSDSATVSGNTFTAGTLSIDLNNTSTYSSGLMYPGDSDNSVSVGISNTGTLDSQYLFKTIPTGNDNSACDYVTVTATDSVNIYTGNISNFTSVAKNTIDKTWNFKLKVNDNAPVSVWGKTCYFAWNYTAWQSNLSDSSSGFTSVKEKSGAIRIGKAVVLNEILYNPKSTDPAPANKEFIELYNNSNIAIDVAGWQVSEISGATEQKYTITTATTGSYRAVPYGGSTTISPKGFMTLQLSVGDALNNTGDTVRLYDASNNKLDEHAYTGGKPEGFSEARMPNDGTSDWRDPIPTPGEPNIDGEVELLLENDSPVILDQKIDTLIKEIVGGSNEEVVEETTTDESATDTITEDETVTADQPAQEAEDATASDEDPAIESEATELESAVESEIASTEELVVEEIVSAEETTDEISAESSNIQADEPETSPDEVVEVVENI